jgi:hypothetical protein
MPVGIEDRHAGATDPEKEPKRNGYVISVNPIKGFQLPSNVFFKPGLVDRNCDALKLLHCIDVP